MANSGERRTAHFRAHERRHVQLEGALWHPGNAEPVGVKVLNLSLAGAGIACTVALYQDERLMVTLLSPSLLDPLALPARVAWTAIAEEPGLVYGGLVFELPERSSLLTLFQLIGTVTY